jgi:hypothetical protein
MSGYIVASNDKLPNELVTMIFKELPYGDWMDRTIPQVCHRWREIFHSLYCYPWAIQIFPAVLRDGLQDDQYYKDYWVNFKTSRRHLKKMKIHIRWNIPTVPDSDKARLTRLVATFVKKFPLAMWSTLTISSFAWDDLDNRIFAEKVLPNVPPEQWLTFPALKTVIVTGRLQPAHTNLLLRAIDRVSNGINMAFLPVQFLHQGASMYPNLFGGIVTTWEDVEDLCKYYFSLLWATYRFSSLSIDVIVLKPLGLRMAARS